jgi:hypothetical protein
VHVGRRWLGRAAVKDVEEGLLVMYNECMGGRLTIGSLTDVARRGIYLPDEQRQLGEFFQSRSTPRAEESGNPCMLFVQVQGATGHRVAEDSASLSRRVIVDSEVWSEPRREHHLPV